MSEVFLESFNYRSKYKDLNLYKYLCLVLHFCTGCSYTVVCTSLEESEVRAVRDLLINDPYTATDSR